MEQGKWIDAETDEEVESPIKEKPKQEEMKEEKVINKDEERDFLIEALKENEEINAWTRYNALQKMVKAGKKLSQEQHQFLTDMNNLQRLEQEKLDRQEYEKQVEAEVRQKIMEEYNLTKEKTPEKIVVAKPEDVSLRGNESIPKLLGFIFTMKTARKKGGKVLVQVFRDRRVLIKWTQNEVTFVEFWTKDEKGNQIQEVTRFSEYKYNFEGSPIPVLFAIQGYAEGFDFFDEFRKDITSEMVARISSRSYHAGYLEGINLRDKQSKKGFLEGLTPFMPLILIIGLFVLGWLMYQMYGEITAMVEVVNQLKAQVTQMAVNTPIVVS